MDIAKSIVATAARLGYRRGMRHGRSQSHSPAEEPRFHRSLGHSGRNGLAAAGEPKPEIRSSKSETNSKPQIARGKTRSPHEFRALFGRISDLFRISDFGFRVSRPPVAALDSGCPARSAFSLIELLVVVALLLILTALYWGSGSASHQQQSQKTCQKNLETLYLALDIYAKDHAGQFPAVTGAKTSEQPLAELVPRYSSDTSVFICPGSKDSSLLPGESLLQRKISYAYYMGWNATNGSMPLMSDRQVDTLAKTAGQPVFSSTGKPPGNNHNKYGGNLLFCDGHLELSPAAGSVPLPLAPGVVLLNPK
jgi:prepilin-type N-terminal cleavage/methylation domain-containing protein/prepilin-type processing-associated H-X9-DG protein